MDFLIDRSENRVVIDAAIVDLDVADFIPEHVELVIWNGLTYSGQIEYNDRPRILESFQNILPFHPVVRECIRHLSGLTLAQAKQIQIQFMDSVAGSKNRLPIRVRIDRLGAPNAGQRNWLARDIDIASVATKTIPSVIGTTGSTTGGLATQINFYGDRTYTTVEAVRHEVPPYIVATGGVYSLPGAAPGMPGGVLISQRSVPWQVGAGSGGDSGAGVESGGASWQTDDLELIDLTLTETGTILQEIAKRSDALLKIWVRKTNEVLALSTMQAVIDYNADVGWPS